MITRRGLLAGAAAGAVAPALAADAETLASAAAKVGLIFGASIDASAFGHPAYLALYRRETQIYVTDVALKFDWLRPTQDTWNFGPADQIVATARADGKLARGHTLIWNDNAPQWLKSLSLREIERVFDEHIEKVVSRYAGQLHSWDVVNEPFWPMDGQTGGWRNGPWYAAMGPAYVDRAFRRVAAIDPRVKLTLNEAQCDNDSDWGRSIRPLLRGLVERLQDQGTPLHAVGLQSHLQSQMPRNYPQYAAYVADLGSRGLEIYLSEFDINDQALPAAPADRDAAAALLAGDYLTRAASIPAVKMVVTWQLADLYSWYRQLAINAGVNRMPRPLPFDNTLQPKPMRAAMIEAFRQRPVLGYVEPQILRKF